MLLCSRARLDTHFAMVVARSPNGGATWAAQGVIKNSWATGNDRGQELLRHRQHADEPVLRPPLHLLGPQQQREDRLLHEHRRDLDRGRPARPSPGRPRPRLRASRCRRTAHVHVVFDTLHLRRQLHQRAHVLHPLDQRRRHLVGAGAGARLQPGGLLRRQLPAGARTAAASTRSAPSTSTTRTAPATATSTPPTPTGRAAAPPTTRTSG